MLTSISYLRIISINNVRNYSNSIKSYNIENKALFGAVIKQKKQVKKSKTKLLIESESSNIKNNNVNLNINNNENDCSSEIYWLLQHHSKQDLSKTTKTTNPLIPLTKELPKMYLKPVEAEPNSSQHSTKEGDLYLEKKYMKRIKKHVTKLPNTLTKFNNALLPNPIKTKPVECTISKKNEIPFTDIELNEIPNYSLWSDDNVNSKKNNNNNDYVLNTDEIKSLPSVGKILQATMSDTSRKALMNWKTLKIAELGLDGFNELQQYHLTTGSNFHLALKNYLKTNVVPDDSSSIIDLWKSVTNVLNETKLKPELIEQSLVHPILKYKGIVDCVSTIRNDVTIIEWKKSDRSKLTVDATFDAPIQLCAYLGALNSDERFKLLNIKNGLIVVAYTNGEPANTFRLKEMDLYRYWRIWLFRLQHYWIMCKDGTLPEPI